LLVEEAGHLNASITELSVISEISSLLGRDTPSDRESIARLLELINQADPTLIAEQLLDEGRLNAALDRITDARLQLWTSYVMLRIMRADDTVGAKEKALIRHVFKRWNISSEAIAG